ncbi:MAG: hypothetical protein Q9160_001392 [Pyrenula sp. 1 TL-2023]
MFYLKLAHEGPRVLTHPIFVLLAAARIQTIRATVKQSKEQPIHLQPVLAFLISESLQQLFPGKPQQYLTNHVAATAGDAAAVKALPESVDSEPKDKPDEPEEPKCDDNNKPKCPDCGGADAQGKCKTGPHTGWSRNKCQTDSSKGCKCFGEVNGATSSLYWMIAPDLKVTSNWQQDLFKIQYGGKASNVPFNDHTPELDQVGCSAPMNQAWDPATVKGMVKTFCKGFDLAKDKTQGFSDEKTGVCTSKVEVKFKKGNGKCSKSCEDTFRDMITRCQHDSHTLNKGSAYSPPCGQFSIGGTLPDYSDIKAQVCYSDASKLPKNGLAQTWDQSKTDAVIDYVCSKKLDPTIKGACSFGKTKEGLMASNNGTGTQFNMRDNSYIHQDTFKDDCSKALHAALEKCHKKGDCGQTYGGSNRKNCVDYQIFMAKAGSPPQAAKDCGAV